MPTASGLKLDDVRIAVVTARADECAAARMMLGCDTLLPAGGEGAGRIYYVGKVPTIWGGHQVVAVVQTIDQGNNLAAMRAALVSAHCRGVRDIIMCGIAGAVPDPERAERHVRLGDLVVSDRGGVIQTDHKKTEGDGSEQSRSAPRPPSPVLLDAVNVLKREAEEGTFRWERRIDEFLESLPAAQRPRWQRPDTGDAYLDDSTTGGHLIEHPTDSERRDRCPRVFYGPIGSANELLKSPERRDQYRDRFGIRAVEMEGSGIADATWYLAQGYLVVRGTSDYCNPAKGDRWQRYAALIAAAYTRSLIESIPPSVVVGPDQIIHRQAGAATQTGGSTVLCPAFLQPAPHFRGRDAVITELQRWWQEETPARATWIIRAKAGAGKTSIVSQLLAQIDPSKQAGHVFVWSFYANSSAEQFFREACRIFVGIDSGGSGQLEALRTALADGRPHVVVLDGLEAVQSDSDDTRPRGTILSLPLDNLVRSLAGGTGNTRMLVTSRIGIPEWSEAPGSRMHQLELPPMTEEEGRKVLRAWRVQGDDARLSEIVRRLGGHAMSIAVLGSYLHAFHGGNPARADEFWEGKVTDGDQDAMRLFRILKRYAEKLQPQEGDFLVKLVVFPRGISLELFYFLVEAGGPVAGTLAGTSREAVQTIAARLCDLGLVSLYQLRDRTTYSAHPFLREFFRGDFESQGERINETIRRRLAESLDVRPLSPPSDPFLLDRYQELIQFSIAAGRESEAFELYTHGLGGYDHIGRRLYQYARGDEIVRQFFKYGNPWRSDLFPDVPATLGVLLRDWARYSAACGELVLAEQCMDLASKHFREASRREDYRLALLEAGDLAIQQGEYRSAIDFAAEAAGEDGSGAHDGHHALVLASAHHGLGRSAEAERYFDAMRSSEIGKTLPYLTVVREAEFWIDRGRIDTAEALVESALRKASQHGRGDALATLHALLGFIALRREKLDVARMHAGAAAEWAKKVSHACCVLSANLLSATVALEARELTDATSQATAVLEAANYHGFKPVAVHAELLLARIALARGDAEKALAIARAAEASSAGLEYKWRRSDALQLVAVALVQLHRNHDARQPIKEAVSIRREIGHPGLRESEALLHTISSEVS